MQLCTLQEWVSKGDIVVWKDDLNANVKFGVTLFGHMMRRDRLGDHNNNVETFVDFINFHRLVVSITVFKNF